MLGKLLKHEFVASSRFMLPTFAALGAITALFAVCVGVFAKAGMEGLDYSIDFFQFQLFSFENGTPGTSGAWIFGMLFGSYILVLVAVSIVALVMVVLRFYSNLLGDEGYLTHTLPVTTEQLLISKFIVHFIWSLLSTLAIIFSMGLIVIVLINVSPDAPVIYMSMKEAFSRSFLLDMAIDTCINIFFNLGASIVLLYASMALGQLFHKARKGGAVVGYIALTMVYQTLVTVPMLLVFTGVTSMDNTVFNAMNMASLTLRISSAVSIVFSVGLWFLTVWLMKKKLNLE